MFFLLQIVFNSPLVIENDNIYIRLGQFVSKFEIEKYTVCGKLILPKKWKGIFNNFFLAQNKF